MGVGVQGPSPVCAVPAQASRDGSLSQTVRNPAATSFVLREK